MSLVAVEKLTQKSCFEYASSGFSTDQGATPPAPDLEGVPVSLLCCLVQTSNWWPFCWRHLVAESSPLDELQRCDQLSFCGELFESSRGAQQVNLEETHDPPQLDRTNHISWAQGVNYRSTSISCAGELQLKIYGPCTVNSQSRRSRRWR